MIGSSDHPMLTFGAPADAVAWVVAVFAVLVASASLFPKGLRSSWLGSSALPLLCTSAALLSLGYFHYYLNGAPRLIDATTYLLEARTFADGSFSFEAPATTGNFRGRFLIGVADNASRLAPIFPPGFPLLLALGIHLGHFAIIGPALAAALVYATHGLALTWSGSRKVALLAACFSVLSACLRYHTAETMSHGLSAVLTTLALWASLKADHHRGAHRSMAALGLILGSLIATRQLTGAVITLCCLGALLGHRSKMRQPLTHLGAIAVGLLPGLALLLSHQEAITGDFLTSAQTRYYALADGPSNCFGIGLGKGCHYEHAGVVAEQGGNGLTLGWAIKNTLHRLHWHALDIANFEPLALVGLLFGIRKWKRVGLLGLPLLAIPLAYSLFYFAGSYPGGGARFFSELIPVWHCLIAAALIHWGAARWGIVASLLGFAVHGVYAHRSLVEPHFGPPAPPVSQIEKLLPKAIERHRKTRGEGEPLDYAKAPLVFFSSAHHFNLSLKSGTFVAARKTHDSRMSVLSSHLGRPPAFSFERRARDTYELVPVHFDQDVKTFVYESEYEYPSFLASDLWTHPEYLGDSCISNGRALALHPDGPKPALKFLVDAPRGLYKIVAKVRLEADYCASIPLGTHTLPGVVTLPPDLLSQASHIDRLEMTPTHP